MAAIVLHELLAAYLAATLCATALAKLRNRRTATAGMMREGVIPGPGVPVALLAVSLAELALATLLAFGVAARGAGLAAAVLFVLFAAYRLVVAAKTKSVTCSCAGEIRTDPGSPPVVLGSTLACLLMAACGGVLAYDDQSPGYPLALLAIAAWAAPAIALAVGMRKRPERPATDSVYTGEFFQLGSAELRVRR